MSAIRVGDKVSQESKADRLPVGTTSVYRDGFYKHRVAATKHIDGWYIAAGWESRVPVDTILPMTVVYLPGAK